MRPLKSPQVQQSQARMFDSELVVQSVPTFDGLPETELWNGKQASLVKKMEDWSTKHLSISCVRPGWTQPVLAVLQDPRCAVVSLHIVFSLDMLGNGRGRTSLERFFGALSSTKVHTLELDYSKFNLGDFCEEFSPALEMAVCNQQIQALRIVLGPNTLQMLARSLRVHGATTRVKFLGITGTKYEVDAFREFALALQECAPSVSHLKLDLRAFDDIYAQALAQCIIKGNITNLQVMNARRLGPKGGAYLAATLRHADNNLLRLVVTGGSIGGKGAKAFADSLEQPSSNCKLTHLDLTYNELGPWGIKRLTRAMRHCNYTLGHELWALPGNEVEEHGELWEHFIQTKTDMDNARLLLAMCTAIYVRRLSTRSALRRLPQEMFRQIGGMFEKCG